MAGIEETRRAKAQAIARALLDALGSPVVALYEARLADGPVWAMWAQRAGERPPSPETIALVIEALSVQPDDPFEGLAR